MKYHAGARVQEMLSVLLVKEPAEQATASVAPVPETKNHTGAGVHVQPIFSLYFPAVQALQLTAVPIVSSSVPAEHVGDVTVTLLIT